MRFKLDKNLPPDAVGLLMAGRLWVVTERDVRIRGWEEERSQDL